jgi:small-conductance mechanosensitive channel
MRVRFTSAVVLCLTLAAVAAAGGQSTSQDEQLERLLASAAASARTGDPPATLTFANRRIVQFRATVLGRTPADRVSSVTEVLSRVGQTAEAPRVTVRNYAEASMVMIGTQAIFVVFPQDVNELASETPAAAAAAASSNLQTALDEVAEIRTPHLIVRAIALAAAASLLFFAGLWAIVVVYRRLVSRVTQAAAHQLERLPGGEIITRLADARAGVRRGLLLIVTIVALTLAYGWLGFVLRQFPYTRPLGESLREGLWSVASRVGQGIIAELPNIAMLIAIFVVARFVVRLTGLAFDAAQQGKVSLPGVHPETVVPTRRIAAALIWAFALIVGYEYLPGSESDAFKGISVFAGLIISLGSSGVMNQAMSGLMLMYSRALRVGDFVKIGEIEGTVTHLGSLSTKVLTPRNEEITIPNALVVSNSTTNFTRNADGGVMTPTSVTIGYNTPWRQVHALLLLAAERTEDLRTEPKPVVLQTALCDFYVQYTLLVSLVHPGRRVRTLAALHANIQDAFNEYGVQIMSPNYEADPEQAKLVPPQEWYLAPAAPPSPAGAKATQGV